MLGKENTKMSFEGVSRKSGDPPAAADYVE